MSKGNKYLRLFEKITQSTTCSETLVMSPYYTIDDIYPDGEKETISFISP